MRAVVQRVTEARVTVADEVVGEIGVGMVVLLGVRAGDTPDDVAKLADKVGNLRIFEDAEGKFNLSARDVNGQFLVVSQFTLYGDMRRGRRPSFTDAAAPEIAAPLVDLFAGELRRAGYSVSEGRFQAHMRVELANDGPVTLILDTEEMARPRRE
jgi:D-aminoacyl-tRNA deacylase